MYDMKYYASLYNKLIDDDVYAKPYGEFVYYNKLNEQDRQYLLIMSACTMNDPDEEQKILEITRLLDRHFSLLQLYGCYDSVRFTEILVDINSKIRNVPLDQIRIIFDVHLLDDINTIRNTNATYGDAQNAAGAYLWANSRKTIEITYAKEVGQGEQITGIPNPSGITNFINATPPTADLFASNEKQLDGAECVFIRRFPAGGQRKVHRAVNRV